LRCEFLGFVRWLFAGGQLRVHLYDTTPACHCYPVKFIHRQISFVRVLYNLPARVGLVNKKSPGVNRGNLSLPNAYKIDFIIIDNWLVVFNLIASFWRQLHANYSERKALFLEVIDNLVQVRVGHPFCEAAGKVMKALAIGIFVLRLYVETVT
jgi:hypothetical protein